VYQQPRDSTGQARGILGVFTQALSEGGRESVTRPQTEWQL